MRDSNSHLTLVIPAFLDLGRSLEQLPRLPALETLLARGTRMESAPQSFEQCLFALFGYQNGAELPVGAVRRVGDGAVQDDKWWYCAEPVHFIADRDRVHVVATRELAVSTAEAQALANLFNSHFAQDGWHIEVAQPERWYLRAPGPQQVRTVSLAQTESQDLRSVLPTGSEALRWHSFLNEIQMLFHGSEVNRTREQNGLPAINGLWPWGGGTAPVLTQRFEQVWSDEPLARGLAWISGSKSNALPETWQPAATGETLAVLSPQTDLSWWKGVEADWFAPVRSALAAGQVEALVIEELTGARYIVTRRELRRWWRRRRPVSACS